MTECNCFASALQVSDSLHRTETALASTSFDHILSVARWAAAVVRQYASCSMCSDPSYFTIYVIILRKAASCYSSLAHSSSASSSPGTASSSSGSSSQGWFGATTRVRIGNFEVDTPLDDHTRSVILRTEVRRASEAAAQLESTLDSTSVKATRQVRDEAALTYQRGLVAVLREELAAVERLLYSV
ncbi:uncharacterized protein PV09_00243 [Verruconis gallopava]|uniref:Uncharacterized protein n=1 Tax=Verruconis gallopava TaxID=253628 RepID=A0A0D2BD16_9PEZI|nr:uncharacterized protein PV09_00243 [Verruconis gallopava]KIW09339.1 hypothetical protein PV09_00243 [Verruconis gallopava]